uniref:Outer envelope membrane protein 7 n=1 Tax=Physcomitrium patens TaxID=3218 RepID=A0A2K1IYR6_PHYPA|nr:hypothetical protein PHYPA_024231 [Physcomitrium patens]
MASHQRGRGLWSTVLIAAAGILLTWAAFEIAMAPVLRPARRAIDKSLDPKYDVDDDEVKDEKENKENEDLEVGDSPGSDDQ